MAFGNALWMQSKFGLFGATGSKNLGWFINLGKQFEKAVGNAQWRKIQTNVTNVIMHSFEQASLGSI